MDEACNNTIHVCDETEETGYMDDADTSNQDTKMLHNMYIILYMVSY